MFKKKKFESTKNSLLSASKPLSVTFDQSTNIPRKEDKAVFEGNGPVPHQEEFGPGQPTLADVYRMMEKRLDRLDRKLDELADQMRETRYSV